MIARLARGQLVSAAAISGDGQLVAMTSGDLGEGLAQMSNRVQVWATGSGSELFNLPLRAEAKAAAFNLSGDMLSVAEGSIVRLLSARTGESGSRTVSAEEAGIVRCLAFDLTGNRIAAGGEGGVVLVYEVDTGKRIARLTHDERLRSIVFDVTFSPDGKYVATASTDRLARIWDVETGREVGRMAHDKDVFAVGFTADGKTLVTGCSDHGLRAWMWRPDDLIAAACARLTRNLTEDEWIRYFGDEPYCRTCSDLPDGRASEQE